MRTVTVDNDFQSKLHGCERMVDVLSPGGETLGHFLPERVFNFILSVWAERGFATPAEPSTRDQTLAAVQAGRYLHTDEAIAIAQRLAELADKR